VKISARNTLKGEVTKIQHGAVNIEVTVKLPGGEQLVSIITKHSAESLGLKVGSQVTAVIKASNVMIAID
jgi:molybdopterin-binding protein